METINQKQDQLETIINNSVFQKDHNLCNTQQDNNNCFDMIPVINEDGLTEFEEKLSTDKTFRSNLVCLSSICIMCT